MIFIYDLKRTKKLVLIKEHTVILNGYLLNCMHKQQDFFGCLAEILGCLGLREAANLEI